MRYLFQFSVLMIFVVLGEITAYFIPLPIAGSVYGLVFLFVALVSGLVKLHWVEGAANWLHGIMSLFFIAPAVAVIDAWPMIKDHWLVLVLMLVAAYMVTMITTGVTAEGIMRAKSKKRQNALKSAKSTAIVEEKLTKSIKQSGGSL